MGAIRRFLRIWVVGKLLKRNPVVFAVATVVGLIRRGRRLAREVPLSTLRSRGRVGADFFERRGLVDDSAPTPDGELADLDAFARSREEPATDAAADGFDPARVDDEVRRFCEQTADYTFAYRVRWGRGFRLGARLVDPLTTRIEQLNLPGKATGWRRLHSRFVALGLPDDPRDGVRGWVRTDEEGACVFLATYGTHVAGADDPEAAGGGPAGERLVNVAVPLPFCTLSTVLRARNFEKGDAGLLGRGGVPGGLEWTTAGPGHPGLYLRFPFLPLRLPVSQRFRVWPAPADAAEEGNDPLRATHEMWLFGLKFLKVEYRMTG
ncbi:hypothetical protein JCM17823_13910 [Halorubrum gandharaense]